jgi:mRNA interferase MazF
MKRGDVVIVSAPGDYGKPRPAVIVQSDFLNRTHESIVLCLVTTKTFDSPGIRIDVAPSASNGLRQRSQIMVDKIITARRDKLSQVVGRIDRAILRELDRCLTVLLGIIDK